MVWIGLPVVFLVSLARPTRAEEARALSASASALGGSLEFLSSGTTFEQVEAAARAALAITLDINVAALSFTLAEQQGAVGVVFPVNCTEGIPSQALGSNVSDCLERQSGEACTVTCQATYVADSADYACHLDGYLRGTAGPLCSKIKCGGGIPSGLINSTCDDKEVGEFCNVTCPPGFNANSTPYECREDGLFHGDALHCERSDCPVSTLPTATGVDSSDCTGKVTSNTCTLTCDYGYQGAAEVVECRDDAIFYGVAPSCMLQSCSSLPVSLGNPEFFHDCADRKHGQTCIVECATGYTGGASTYNCDATSLVGSVPTCTANECNTNTPAGNGVDSSSCSGKRTTETCTPVCSFGFVVSTPATAVVCGSDGRFNDSSLACTLSECANLSSMSLFQNISLSHDCDSVSYLTSCSVHCANGYEIVGQAKTFECTLSANATSSGGFENRDGSSTLAPPTCVPKNCTVSIPAQLGVTHDCDGKRTGETCSAVKSAGYNYASGSGPSTLVCSSSGAFIGSLPTVEPAICGTLSVPVTAASTCANKAPGSFCWAYCLDGSGMAQYECVAGISSTDYQPVTSALSCARRLLSFLAPPRQTTGPCDASASDVGLASLGTRHDCFGKGDGEVCIAECGQGYDVNGTPSMYRCSKGRFVVERLASCLARACSLNLPFGLGVAHDCAGARTGAACTASCGTGYRYGAGSGPKTFTCQETGALSGSSPSCEPEPCRALAVPEAYQGAGCAGKAFGETCLVHCRAGWTLQGPAEVFSCLHTGAFSGRLPTCVPNACSARDLLADPRLDLALCRGLRTGERCWASCRDGLVGNGSTLACSASGALVGRRPACVRSVCQDTVPAAWGVVHNCSRVPFQGRCMVGCRGGGAPPQAWGCLWDEATRTPVLRGELPGCGNWKTRVRAARPRATLSTEAVPRRLVTSNTSTNLSNVSTNLTNVLTNLSISWTAPSMSTNLTNSWVVNYSLCVSPSESATMLAAAANTSSSPTSLITTLLDELVAAGAHNLVLASAFVFQGFSLQELNATGACAGGTSSTTASPAAGTTASLVTASPEGNAGGGSGTGGAGSPGRRRRAGGTGAGVGSGGNGAGSGSGGSAEGGDSGGSELGGGGSELGGEATTTEAGGDTDGGDTHGSEAGGELGEAGGDSDGSEAGGELGTSEQDGSWPEGAAGKPWRSGGRRWPAGAPRGQRHLGGTFEDSGMMGPLQWEGAYRLCDSVPAAVCTSDPQELCFWDESCSSDPPFHGGLGCNAGGVGWNCRFCGFKHYIPCDLDRENFKIPCTRSPAAVCAGPHEPCFFDPDCSEFPPGGSGGLGCNAGGVGQNCRFCGFGEFESCPMPVVE